MHTCPSNFLEWFLCCECSFTFSAAFTMTTDMDDLPTVLQITFAAADSMTSLKLIESGMPKERLALFAVPMVPIQIILPLMISKYTHGPRPMDIFLKAYPYR